MAANSSQIVPNFVSDESCECSNEHSPPPKRQRQNVTYKTQRTFASLAEAKLYIVNQHLWQYKFKSNSIDGDKLIYLCKYSSKCSARVCVWLPNNTTEASVQSNECDHDHSAKQMNGIPPDCKEAILELWNQGTRKPKSILDALRKKEILCPTVIQLNNYLVRVRRGEGPPILSLGQLESFVTQSSTVPPIDDLDKPFVVNYNFDYDQKNFGVFWSSHRLLSLMDKTSSINIDATYKLTFLGFPVIITGTTDKARHFHPFGIALLSNENTEAFSFVFNSLIKTKASYKPTVLIADCAPSITNAFETTFGKNYTRVFCWYHVKRNLDNKLKSVPKEKYNQVQSDLYQLQCCLSLDQFKVAFECFFNKWSRDENLTSFLQYFKTEYFDQRFNWFEGAALGYPSSNNALEATNAIIKKEHTLRERLSIQKFIETAEEIVRKWSTERQPNDPSAKV